MSAARWLAPLAQRMRLMVARAVVQVVNDGAKLQGLQVSLLADELRDDVERFQQYGFTSHPHPGAEAVALCVAGSRDHVLVVSVDDRRYRLQGLQQGEVALYTDEGDRIVIKRGGVIEVTASTRLNISAPEVRCTGSLHVVGDVTTDASVTAAVNVRDQGGAKSMAGMRAAFNGHGHSGGGAAAPQM